MYVKVFAGVNGIPTFNKDRYTDLRGKFDHAFLSTGDLDGATRFSVIMMDAKLLWSLTRNLQICTPLDILCKITTILPHPLRPQRASGPVTKPRIVERIVSESTSVTVLTP